MKTLIISLFFVITAGVTSAYAEQAQTLKQLKVQYKSLTPSKKRFFIHSRIIQKYASLPKNYFDDHKQIKKMAYTLLRNSKKYKNNWNYSNAIRHSSMLSAPT